MTESRITLAPAEASEFAAFKKDLQRAFAVAVIEEFGDLPSGPIPSDEDLDASIGAAGAETLLILGDGEKIGGAVVVIDKMTQQNSLDLFFMKPSVEGAGLGHQAWLAIERRYPRTRLWRTYTPYFEKRNIHFYVNKCGFKITAFFNSRHVDPNHPMPDDLPSNDGFLFEKIM